MELLLTQSSTKIGKLMKCLVHATSKLELGASRPKLN